VYDVVKCASFLIIAIIITFSSVRIVSCNIKREMISKFQSSLSTKNGHDTTNGFVRIDMQLQDQVIGFKPIGIVRRKESDDEVRQEHAGLESVIEIYPKYREGLEGLEGFSHIFVVGYFHKLRPEQIGPLKVRPKRLVKYGLKLEELPYVGVFTLDSPTRPNPIGLSLVKLVRIEDRGARIIVSDLEYFDETPVLDIKPYQDGYRSETYKLPEWNTKLAIKAGLGPSISI
jgi:tRNA-Thr(GGU) m(6)t(6)A37 methyltransferase TsaA